MILPIDDQYALRSFKASDKAPLTRLGNNARVSANLRDGFPYPYTPEAAEEWLGKMAGSEAPMIFAITEKDKLIGGAGIHSLDDVYRFSAEVGYWLGVPFWGKGIATRAVKTLVDYAFENTRLIKLFAGVYSSNPSSARVLEKNGFVLEGRLRNAVVKREVVLDELRYGLLREEWAARPPFKS